MNLGVSRLGSKAWWAVYLFACLAMSLFIAFELLDLDGSTIRGAISRATITTETGSAEAERLAHLPPAPSILANDPTSHHRRPEFASLTQPLFPEAATLRWRIALVRPRSHTSGPENSDAPGSIEPA